MRPTEEKVQLTASEAACLDAVRAGLDGKTKIAIEIGRDLKTVAAALERLNRAGLIGRTGRFRWHQTERGRSCSLRVVPDPQRRKGGKVFGRLVAGSTAERLLDALDQPMRGAELADCLGVTKQRVHQLVVRLHAQGRLRLGDRGSVLLVVARSDDPSVLLTRDEERILSALPDDAATSAIRLRQRARMPASRMRDGLVRLHEKGLVEQTGWDRGQALYRLSPEGRRHFQRRASARRAEPTPLKVKSDRVRDVLSYIAEQGEARIRDVRDALGVPQASMNALMQYLKRRGLVRKVSGDLSAPYELTREGNDTLAEMFRRSG